MTSQNNKFAILASGNGSNAQALIEGALAQNARFECVITDNPNAGVIQRCEELNVECFVIERDSTKQRHEKAVLRALRSADVNWLFLAGYMRILSESFLTNFQDQKNDRFNVVNIHPSLLPAYPGLDGYRRAFEDGIPKSGASVHFVDAGVDTGKIIAQSEFERLPNDDLEQFSARGLALEHKLYTDVFNKILKGEI